MCSLEKKGRVFILTLTGNGDHRFNPTSIKSIIQALQTVIESPDAGALVTTNDGRFFSNGLDLKWISENPTENLKTICIEFENMLASFMRVGLPTIAAMTGHAAAGGFMLGLAHDYRYMSRGRSVLYMSEVDLGMVMPRSLMSVIASKVPSPSILRDIVMKAHKFSPDHAFKVGIVDKLFDDPAQTLSEAVLEAERLASRNWNRDVYRQIRLGAYPGVVEVLESHCDPYVLPISAKL